ncbi:guanylate kinase-associated protein mars [Melanaphis sacchari]|uniref:Disks large-associated protein 1 n=1 Tax=Melanaphis sacchari TaxID=742174 RepID=A0A2H8TE55_9HEMI|nr:guanylate kinase-associated protein mars [Melanaphis sacchari]
MTTKKSQSLMKENRIPIGKKKENIEKTKILKKNEELELVEDHAISKMKTLKTSKVSKKTNKSNECKPLKLININVESTDTSLMKPMKKPRVILSAIKELKEFEEKSNTKTTLNKIKIVKDNAPTLNENENNLQEEIDMDNLNNTIDKMKPVVPEIVLSPFVCTTRGHKWKPSPRKPPKLSELYDKYEDNNVADNYRKKLDSKTIELQNKVKYWAELSSENSSNIPQSVKDEIDVVCGQTKLLTTDKFMQMRSLINEFDNKSGAMLITTDDLDGFWDMLLLQVEKLEGQFSQLAILKTNNWAPLKPIAKQVINKLPTLNKRPVVKSKFADFIKTQKLKEEKSTLNNENSNDKNNSKFNEMKLSNNTYLTSSTPTSSNQKNLSFTPVLLKTMELSYVARRSGMTPIVLGTPHVSPLKPALKKVENEKGTKRKNIHFESPKKIVNGFVTPENSCDENIKLKTIQNRVVTPHTIKKTKVNQNNEVKSRNKPIGTSISNQTGNITNLKNTLKAQSKMKKTVTKTLLDMEDDKSSIRRSSRLANKPSKNYKC